MTREETARAVALALLADADAEEIRRIDEYQDWRALVVNAIQYDPMTALAALQLALVEVPHAPVRP